MNRPLTPDEADALAAPEIQREVKRINDYLTTGGRKIVVMDALGDAIADIYRAAGWNVEITCRNHGKCNVNLSRANGPDPAAVGAELLSTSAQRTT